MKPSDLDLHCLKKDKSGFNRTRVNILLYHCLYVSQFVLVLTEGDVILTGLYIYYIENLTLLEGVDF